MASEEEASSGHASSGVSTFTFTACNGSAAELLAFLGMSHRWFSSLPQPPSRDQFKTFLQGAYSELDLPSPSDNSTTASASATKTTTGSTTTDGGDATSGAASGSPSAKGKGCDEEKERLLDSIQKQARELESLLESHGDEELTSRTNPEGEWHNFTLDGFIEAAADVSEFREGNYEPSWRYLCEFYHLGQTA